MTVFVEFAITLLVAALTATAAYLGRFSLPNVSRQTANILFTVMATLYALTFGALSILRHMSMHSGGFDLGIFDQIIWNSLHGRLFESSIIVTAPVTLGQHFSPLLLAIVPLYTIWADPITLLVLQTLALALGGLGLYWFARTQIGNLLALAVTAAYYLSPALQSINLWEFHEIALATPLLMFALYFLFKRRYVPFLVCLTLAWLVKEEVGIIAAAFGVFVALFHRRRRMGAALVVGGLTWAIVMLLYIIPSFRNPTYGLDYQYVDRYGYLGNSVPQIATTILTQPGLVIEHLLSATKMEFVLQLLVPLALIPLVGGEVLALVLPTTTYLLIGDNVFQNSIRFQYAATLLPPIFFATVIGLKRLATWRVLHNRFKRWSVTFPVVFTLLISVASVVNYKFQSPGPLGNYFDPEQYTITAHTLKGYEVIRQLPAKGSILTDGRLAPHLSQRRDVYETNIVTPPNLRNIEYLFTDLESPVNKAFPILWEGILASPYFETLFEQDGYLIKKRATPAMAHPTPIRFENDIALVGYTIETGESARRGDTMRLVLTWRADAPVRTRYVAFVHLVDSAGRTWAQDDHEPMNGWLRTDRWNAGDVTPERFVLELPTDMPPGEYKITSGFYAVTDQKNLMAFDSAGRALGSEPILGILQVSK